MKPVMQDAFGDTGNCFSACLASLFEIDLKDVPNFFVLAGNDANVWWKEVRNWLRPRGFGVMSVAFTDAKLIGGFEGWLIVCGESQRGFQHATLWRDGMIVHDPHPSQCGIISPDAVDLLYPLDPSALQVRAIT